MANKLLVDYLNRSRALYSLESHPASYTALALAHAGHIDTHHLAKTVMVSVGGELSMVIVPACYQLDLLALTEHLGAGRVELVGEDHFYRRFPRCEVGAVPPFGHLYGLNSYLVPLFELAESVAFCAGTHHELIRMPFAEFSRFAHATEISPFVVFGSEMPGNAVSRDVVDECNAVDCRAQNKAEHWLLNPSRYSSVQVY